MGQCLAAGWTEKQFWSSTYRAVQNLVYTIQKRRKTEYRERWNQTRLICHIISSPYRKKSERDKPVFELPWDTEQTLPDRIILTGEELQKQKAKFAKWDAEMKEKANGKK